MKDTSIQAIVRIALEGHRPPTTRDRQIALNAAKRQAKEGRK